ncbi:MAG: hypothetical protein MI749_05890, partial [Desulfovibrionales bacterium]|nr:hypothetical protein [Desulfovibrionales bacterium]
LKACSREVATLFALENKAVISKMEAKGAKMLTLPDGVMERWTRTAVQMWDEEFTKDALSAEYIDLAKKHLKRLGYTL